jgi:hypothetical protein
MPSITFSGQIKECLKMQMKAQLNSACKLILLRVVNEITQLNYICSHPFITKVEEHEGLMVTLGTVSHNIGDAAELYIGGKD